MTIDDKIRDEIIQYDSNRQAAKISASSSRKIDKYEFLTSEEILPSDQGRVLERAKFSYSRLGKAFGKQAETIKDQGIKQIEAFKPLTGETLKSFEGFFLKNMRIDEIQNKIYEMKKIEVKLNEKI